MSSFEGGSKKTPMEEKHYSLVFCRRLGPDSGKREVLLGMKKRGFGTGKFNGYGGKQEPGESMITCAIREMEEESGLLLTEVIPVGYLHFTMGDSRKIMHVHVFESYVDASKVAVETDEMRPQWFCEDSIPFPDMWADDPVWFPLFLSGRLFSGRFIFSNDNTIIEHDLKLTPSGAERQVFGPPSSASTGSVWENFSTPADTPSGFSLKAAFDSATNPSGQTTMLEKWNCGTFEPPHSHPSDDMTVVVEGLMSVQFYTLSETSALVEDGAPLVLSKGEVGYVKANRIHSARYLADCKLVYVHDGEFAFKAAN